MSVSLFFVRHAKPAQQGVLLGHTDSLLAEPIVSTSFAEHLKAQPVQRVISSPLLRAKDTAALLFPLLPVVIDEQLKECNFGLWDGKTYPWLWQHAPSIGDFWQDPWTTTPPEGESMRDFSSRVLSFFSTLLDNPVDGNTVVVSHAGVMKLIYLSLFGLSRPTGEVLANIEFQYLSGFRVDVFYDEHGKAWPKVVI
jgi:alpha-ribazole phosphatase